MKKNLILFWLCFSLLFLLKFNVPKNKRLLVCFYSKYNKFVISMQTIWVYEER
jgi:hypothetical protein